MKRAVHGLVVHGIAIDPETRCAHYRSAKDIVALKFKCCGEWFACHRCHEEIADHPATVWPKSELDQRTVLCGGCGNLMSARQYLQSNSACPACARSFNAGCAKHAHYYFEV